MSLPQAPLSTRNINAHGHYTLFTNDCSLDLDLCGCKLKYEVSFFDNCERLEKAIKEYSEIKEKEIIPVLLDLQYRCEGSQEILQIKERVVAH